MKIEDLNLYALKYFLDTVETGSVTKAAEMNFVTRSAVSQALTRLETWAGQALVTHEKRNFQLTPQGENFYRHMKSSYEGFKVALTGQSRSPQVLRVGCSASLAEGFLFPAFQKLENLQGLHLVTGTSRQLAHQLSEGALGLVIYVTDVVPLAENTKVIQSGSFVLASAKAQQPKQIITTENRPEVLQLKNYFHKKKAPVAFLTVESWSLAAKMSTSLGAACLVPDFFLDKSLKKIETRGFSHPYKVVLQHQNREQLSLSEIQLLKVLSDTI